MREPAHKFGKRRIISEAHIDHVVVMGLMGFTELYKNDIAAESRRYGARQVINYNPAGRFTGRMLVRKANRVQQGMEMDVWS